MDYRQLLRIMLENTKQQDLARELKTTQATISRWLSGQEPRGAALERIRNLARARRLAEDATIEQGNLESEAQILRAHQTISPNDKSYSMKSEGDIASFNAHAGMSEASTPLEADNSGASMRPLDIDGFWSFPEEIKSGWPQMDQTYAMPVTGDSMEPTLSNGSHVFVDTSHNYPSPPDLYAINYGHGLMVKRIELLPGDKIRVISDNDRYSDFEFQQNEVEVFGRVVASFKRHG
jgi:phage repressor protein C with HTH and peptisase S24 domain